MSTGDNVGGGGATPMEPNGPQWSPMEAENLDLEKDGVSVVAGGGERKRSENQVQGGARRCKD